MDPEGQESEYYSCLRNKVNLRLCSAVIACNWLVCSDCLQWAAL